MWKIPEGKICLPCSSLNLKDARIYVTCQILGKCNHVSWISYISILLLKYLGQVC